MRNNENVHGFENLYKTLEEKISFLRSFDLINLQKAGRIARIPIKKMENKNLAIKSILTYDVKNKFLICKTMFNNPNEYLKSKAEENRVLKTTEINQLELAKYEDHLEDWNKIKNNFVDELNDYKGKMENQQLMNNSNSSNSIQDLQVEKNIKPKNSVKVFTIKPQESSSYTEQLKDNFLLEIKKIKKILSVETKKDFVKKEKTITIKGDLE